MRLKLLLSLLLLGVITTASASQNDESLNNEQIQKNEKTLRLYDDREPGAPCTKRRMAPSSVLLPKFLEVGTLPYFAEKDADLFGGATLCQEAFPNHAFWMMQNTWYWSVQTCYSKVAGPCVEHRLYKSYMKLLMNNSHEVANDSKANNTKR